MGHKWRQLQTASICLALAIATANAANDNAHEYKVLCDLLSLSKGLETLSLNADDQAADKFLTDIFLLNLTTATDSFRENKDGELEATAADKKGNAIEDWQKKIKSLSEKEGEPPQLKYPRPENSAARQAANAQIATMYDRAKALAQEYRTEITNAKANNKEAQKHIADALFGEGKTAFDQATMEANIEDNCKSTGGAPDKIAQSVSHDLICICVAGVESSDSNGICKQGLNIAAVKTGNGKTGSGAEYIKLLNECKLKAPESGITPQLLRARIGVFLATVGSQAKLRTTGDGRYILGKPHSSNGCNGSSGEGVCVDYATHLKDGTGRLPWQRKLEAAADKLEQARSEMQQATRIKNQLIDVQTTAWAAFKAATVQKQPTKLAPEQKNHNKQAVSSICVNLNTKKTCTAASCKWEGKNETDGKCIVDENKITEQTSAAGEQAGGTTTDMCSEAKTPEASAKVTGTKHEGKNAACGWIDYIDGTGKVEAACRSSISFLNKKCALISAIFVNSLYFDNSKDFAQFHEIYEIDEALYF
uniref:Variant surface glycoprotein 1125.117 n=1 Tax=Trypanosoma brucei TaxID=5691 RepID=A0A1J0R598_9TRYP|nr:variant surface glycoprotein 1125.117 [Trypanosoma brucei]